MIDVIRFLIAVAFAREATRFIVSLDAGLVASLAMGLVAGLALFAYAYLTDSNTRSS